MQTFINTILSKTSRTLSIGALFVYSTIGLLSSVEAHGYSAWWLFGGALVISTSMANILTHLSLENEHGN